MAENSCPLCGSKGRSFFADEKHRFFTCDFCRGIFRAPEQALNFEQERNRYLLHKNHLQDQGYLNFVSPILAEVRSRHKPGAEGLDFGCGHTPVISEVLKNDKYLVDHYDPLFFPQKIFEGKTYDFIVCCEVMEHFLNPKKEFVLLAEHLKPTGNLICMTSLFSEEMDFNSWYYKNDPTHVFLYRKETLAHITAHCNFSHVKIEEPLIVFSK
jgi:hypothetical protein